MLKIRPLNGRLIDLYCGVGGLSLGMKEAGFSNVFGIDSDILATTVYRARVGPCVTLSVDDKCHPPYPADVVLADIPWDRKFTEGVGGDEAAPDEEVFHTFRIAVEAEAQVVVIVTVPQGRRGHSKSTVIEDPDPNRFATVRCINEIAHNAKFMVKTKVMDCMDYGDPQTKRKVVTIATRGAPLLSRIKWPIATHTGGKRKEDPVKVSDILDIDYPFPSPPITSSEFKASWKGHRGGTTMARRASERIAGYVGRAKWGQRNVCLEAWELAALQSLPSWDWSKIPKRSSLPLIGRVFPVRMATALGHSIYTGLYGEKVGVRTSGVSG